MDDTRSPDILDTSPQKLDLSDYDECEMSNEPQIDAEESVYEEIPSDMKVFYITLSKLMKDCAIKLDLDGLEESEHIRKMNELIERIQRVK